MTRVGNRANGGWAQIGLVYRARQRWRVAVVVADARTWAGELFCNVWYPSAVAYV